jgi:putative ABC transport system ATP-binding protein
VRAARPAIETARGPSTVTCFRKPAVELDRVSKMFDSAAGTEVPAIVDVDLTVSDNSSILLTGPSGSGKTTLLSLIGCMVRATSGRMRLAGSEITRLPEEMLARLRRERVGFVFQSHHLIDGTSALDNVMVPALPSACIDGDLRGRAMALLSRFGLAGRAREKVGRLSGGERQRVAIARALIHDPALFIADEPTGHLDGLAAAAFLDFIDELQEQGKTVLVSSHDAVLLESDRFSRVLELRDGRLIRG